MEEYLLAVLGHKGDQMGDNKKKQEHQWLGEMTCSVCVALYTCED